MKNYSDHYKSNKLNLLVIAFILLTFNLGCSFSVGKPDMPSTEQQNALVKQTLKDFTKSIESGDFSSLRSSASKELQEQVSADKLKSAFGAMIDKKDEMVPILQSADSKTPQFSNTPTVIEEGSYYTTQLKGSFPTDPLKTIFDFKYVWQDSQWKLVKIEVETNN